MTETMLVRTAGGGWEELQPQTSLPDGGMVELFGEDIGPVLGSPGCVVVAAARPQLPTGTPDALCVDADGGVWIVQLALDGGGEATLPQLLAFGGALNGMSWSAFEQLCDRRGPDTLDSFIEARAGSGFHRESFRVAVTEALATGRIRMVSIVREAAPTLVQSMRFLNASGAMGSVYEASSFASASVTAVRAKAVDVGMAGAAPAPAAAAATTADVAAPAPARTASTSAKSAPSGTDAFIAATGKHTDAATSALMRQLLVACDDAFDDITYSGSGASQEASAVMQGGDAPAALLVAGVDGSVVLSFESLGTLDSGWTVRAELCQGMERLLGTDLGDVRKISQLNLSIGEHLMDATLMDALIELLVDTTASLRGSDRTAAAA